jgi:glycosyltransferase involved in cell wall biosynthesis
MKLSAVVLTRNEERNIKGCLASLSWADELLVVDSGSTDGTVALAEKQGARVVTSPFTDFATQRNFAMSQAMGGWVLFVDADEQITPALAEEIIKILRNPTDESRKAVYAIPRHTYFFGKRLRFSDARTDAPIRLFPKSSARWEQPVHEKVVTDLPVRSLKNPMPHSSTRDLAHYKKKVRDYVPLELETMRKKGLRPSLTKSVLLPPAKFVFLYFWKLGILDGLAGFQYAILSAYYTFEKHWRYYMQHRND